MDVNTALVRRKTCKIATQAAKKVGLGISRQALNTVDQLVHGIAERMAQDLEAFAKHRKGSKSQGKTQHFKINVDDVKMLDRSHEELTRKLDEFSELCENEKEKLKGNKKRKADTSSPQNEAQDAEEAEEGDEEEEEDA